MSRGNDNSAKIDLKTFKLSRGAMCAYSLGDFGYNFMYYWISTYLAIYYTDTIGIPAATISFMMIIVRIFDAINDPFIGSLADRTRSRWGRYRPWFIIGSIIMGIFIVLTFSASADWSYKIRLIWMWVIYLLLTVASTCSNMPYGALGSCISPNTEDRSKAGSMRMVFSNVGSMIMLIVAVPLITAFSPDGSATHQTGYFWALVVTCVIGIPTMVISGVKTKEIVTPPPAQTSVPMKLQIKALLKNRPIIILTIGQFILGCNVYGRGAMLAYYWQYNAGNAGLATIYGFVSLGGVFVGSLWLGNFVFNRLKHKGKCCALLNFFAGAAYIAMFFTTAPSIGFWILTFVSNTFFFAFMGIHFGTIGDGVDYGEYISEVRCDGFLCSIVSVANKAGGAVMPAVGMAVLAALNYTANTAQSTEVLFSINAFITLIPGIMSIINAFVYLAYPISTDKHREIMNELIRRRENA